MNDELVLLLQRECASPALIAGITGAIDRLQNEAVRYRQLLADIDTCPDRPCYKCLRRLRAMLSATPALPTVGADAHNDQSQKEGER